MRQVKAPAPLVVTLDLGLPPAPDDAVEAAHPGGDPGRSSETKVIVVTGNEERAHAVRAIALGAYDFYQKPIDGQVLSLIVKRAFNVFDLEAENRRLQHSREPSFQGIVTSSEAMLALCRTVEKVAPTDISVLLLGESGTGKELVARALHNLVCAAVVPSSPSTAPPSRRTCWRASCSATSAARSRGRPAGQGQDRAGARRARCSWTRSATCR